MSPVSSAIGISTTTFKPGTHWRQSRKNVRHSGDKVDRVGDNVDRDKLSNSTLSPVVADLSPKPVTKSTVSATVDFVTDLSPVSATVDFVASVYRALELLFLCSDDEA